MGRDSYGGLQRLLARLELECKYKPQYEEARTSPLGGHTPGHRYLACKRSNGEVIAIASSPPSLYKELKRLFNIRFPDIVEIHRLQALGELPSKKYQGLSPADRATAERLVQSKIEREAKRQMRKRAYAILKEQERAEGRYPWLKKP